MTKKLDRDEVRRAARKLSQKAGWSTHDYKPKSDTEKLQELDAEQKGSEAYAESKECEDCAKSRRKGDDPTALCEQHLAEAMGF